ncbi:YceI family protein [Flavobacteriaceae bacterium D16]|nr:YceI family protein [Flavobacteriaceae bacterium D16]
MLRYRFVILLVFSLIIGNSFAIGQSDFKTTSGQVEFNASTPLEDIRAINKDVNALFKDTGELAIVLLIREFDFRRKLMQEHFNENYLESDRYPKSYFLGKIQGADIKSLDARPLEVTLVGKLNLHGVTKNITVTGNLSKKGREMLLNSTFIIRPEDYGVEIPTLMFKKIAREVEVNFTFQMTPQ